MTVLYTTRASRSRGYSKSFIYLVKSEFEASRGDAEASDDKTEQGGVQLKQRGIAAHAGVQATGQSKGQGWAQVAAKTCVNRGNNKGLKLR